ncbi:glycoside hydrolase family 16 protein [Methylobacterium longum]|uniref:Glycoside hydrolase family 16 protein n=1 Tax=Methylobacterium longum TaxID=767694 RepID=A0ABT8AQL3_9HYPH|nr:glycoside hydrolase family 16 protein [Methylobacterium longum]MDN3572119.1 glycoside hydrolase family 16 protein [Methylobacterium longum]GJE15253.1 Endo-1,3-1,4-beta-glycanase ExsH [Methylobacterium longum]
MPSIDRTKLVRTFSEEFDLPLAWWSDERQPPRSKIWRTGYEHSRWPSVDTISSRYLGSETQVYIDPTFRDLGIDPFSVANDKLTITARLLTSDESKKLDGRKFSSGLISSAQVFEQVYGYFECRAKLPANTGFFPAFWLYTFSGQTEIDVMECLTGSPRVLYNGAIQKNISGNSRKWNQISKAEASPGPDLSADFHSFGVLWTPARIEFYLDDIFQWGIDHTPPGIPSDPGFHEPMFMVVNLAVDGQWSTSKGFKANGIGQMLVEHIRAYQIIT